MLWCSGNKGGAKMPDKFPDKINLYDERDRYVGEIRRDYEAEFEDKMANAVGQGLAYVLFLLILAVVFLPIAILVWLTKRFGFVTALLVAVPLTILVAFAANMLGLIRLDFSLFLPMAVVAPLFGVLLLFRKSFGAKRFVLGIPMILIGGFLLLFVFGVSVGGLPFFPGSASGASASPSLPASPAVAAKSAPPAPVAPSLASAAAPASPGLKIEARDVGWETQENCITCLIPNWSEPAKPGQYEWRVSYPASKPALLRLGWCAKDKPTLDGNWSNMAYSLLVDDTPVDLQRLSQKEQSIQAGVCHFYAGEVMGWTPGQHSYVWTHEIKQAIHDGWDGYAPGQYVMKFVVDVK